MSGAIASSVHKPTLDDLSFVWLEITGQCNLTCSHCYADSGPHVSLHGNMGYEDWCQVIDEAAELGCREVQFIGGEPTMHPRLNDLVDRANHRGFEFIEVFTNATRLNQELIGCFQRNQVRVATSFYSIEPTVHEKITHGKGSWGRTVTGIKAALAAGLDLRVGIIETDHNVGHVDSAVDFVKGLGVTRIGVDHQRGVGRGGVIRLYDEDERYDELCGECWKGKLCVTSSGQVFPCVFSRATRLGDARQGMSTVLRSATLSRFRQKVRSDEENRAESTPVSTPQEGEEAEAKCSPCSPSVCGPCPPCSPCSPAGTCAPCTPCSPAGCAP